MQHAQAISRVVDLLGPSGNVLHGMTDDQARALLARGNPDEVCTIRGHFALWAQDGSTIRLARTIGRLMRYFIAKQADGPILILSDRIDTIHAWLAERGMDDQFHPSYTRMVPAHYVVEIRLVGCPDPNPVYRRFVAAHDEPLPADLDVIGERYIGAALDEIVRSLSRIGPAEPVGVSFSGGIDSGAIFLLTYHAMLKLGLSPSRLKAFTLSVDGGGEDVAQAREFLQRLGLELFHETIDAARRDIDPAGAIRVIEDYKPLDVEAAAVNIALLRGIRGRYPDWRHLFDGDGGDENLKDYPIEDNPELTIRSVVNNPMLYQEGWGVESIKHSLTYSGGQSRGYARTYAPAARLDFCTVSPLAAPAVVACAASIPFAELAGMDHERLYALKGEIVGRGVRRLTGLDMPIFAKRRFQHGAMSRDAFAAQFASRAGQYRRMFHALYE
jgi:asparagine synthase (glutamine-hydrolysing)